MPKQSINSSDSSFADSDSSGQGKALHNLQAPFPYFGGKSKVAQEVWARFGNPDNYVEPFGGSLAVLLARPHSHEWWLKKETVGDYSGMVVNFYRAIAANPEEVTQHANWPVTEADLTARHLYLVRYQNDLAEKLTADPAFYDAQAAGWWVWGLSAWVGGDWMTGKGPWKPGEPEGPGVYRKMPMIAGSHGGKGIHKPLSTLTAPEGQHPDLHESYGEALSERFHALSDRLRRVRIACGDWSRLTGAAVDPGAKKVTAIFLDPPYDLALRRADLYGATDHGTNAEQQVHEAARTWAIQEGENPLRRIAYCSYSTDEEDALFEAAGWVPYRWSAQGGYGLQSDNAARANKDKEVIWFSPHCIKPSETSSIL
jgi:site-specific DNA-adenine methylase